MTAHPYPPHVAEAVTETVFEYYDRSDGLDVAASNTANVALTALWKADQPSTISADEARLIWFKAVDARNGDTESMHELRMLLAKHAPDWGNQRSTND